MATAQDNLADECELCKQRTRKVTFREVTKPDGSKVVVRARDWCTNSECLGHHEVRA